MVLAAIVQIFHAQCLLCLDCLGATGTSLEKTLFVGEGEIREVLFGTRYPAITNQKTRQVPLL